MIEYRIERPYPNPFHLDVEDLDSNGIIDFSESGGELHLFYKTPSEIEVNNIWFGDIRAALTYIKGIIFIQIKFGKLPWHDMAYNAQISKLNDSLMSLQEMDMRTGCALSIILVDSDTQLVKALRVVALSHRFSQELRKAMNEQLEDTFFIKMAYENNVRTILGNMASNDLLKYAVVNEKLR